MTTEGYIFLHRKILDSDLWALTSEQIIVALVCLLRARWSDGIVKGIPVKRGQWLTHYHTIQECCPKTISLSQVRHAVKRLSSKEVTFFSTRVVTRFGRKFLLLTVCKYEDYQNPDLWTTRKGITGVSSRVSHGYHSNNIRKEEEKKEDVTNRPGGYGGYVDNSHNPASLVSDLAEEKALANVDLVNQILEVTRDPENIGYYEKRVRQIPHGRIHGMLSVVKIAKRQGEIKKSPGAMLKHLIKLELQEATDATT